MQVRLWRSFSGNNSSSHYVVATFESAEKAGEVAKTLDAQFEEATEDDGFYLWQADDPPQVFVEGSSIVVYHSYCGGLYDGFDLPGTKTYSSAEGTPQLTVFCHTSDSDRGRDRIDELEKFFAKREKERETSEWGMAPWGAELPYADAVDDVVWWTDGKAAGFHIPFDDVASIRSYLQRDGFDSYQILLADTEVRAKLAVLEDARRCPSCQSASLTYVPAGDSVPEEQMSCSACGGMFGISALRVHSPRARLDEDRLMLIRGGGGQLFATSWESAVWRRDVEGWRKLTSTPRRVSGLLVTDELVIVTGERALLHVSRDRGESWTAIKTFDADPIWAAAQAPDGTLFAVGSRGTLLRSEDGENWRQNNATKFDLLDVSAASNSVIYACGKFGKILRSSDGGRKWTVTQSPVESPLCRIGVVSENNVVIVGDRNVVLETSDGETWKRRALDDNYGDIEDIAVGPAGAMFAVTSQGFVLSSADGWKPVGSSIGKHLRGVCVFEGALYVCGAGGTVRRIDEADVSADSTERCHHAKFGAGVVVERNGDKITVDFEIGRKTIAERFLTFD